MTTLAQEESRLSIVLAIERLALIGRYFLYALAAVLFFIGDLEAGPLRIAVISGALLMHNVFAHWVLVSRKHELFLGWANFAIYFVEITVIIAFTGAADTDAFALYYLFLIGFAAYCANLRLTLATAVLCGVAYVAVIVGDYIREPFEVYRGVLVVRLGFFFICAWLIGTLTERLRRTEEASLFRAQALAASEATLRTILDSAADPILVFDRGELIVEANDRACEFFGVPRRDLLGMRIRRFLFDDGTLPNKVATVTSRGEYRGEVIVVTADGEERTVDFVLRAFIREEKNYYVTLLHDITEQKSLREATRLTNADLARLNRELRQVDELKTHFLVTVSKRIRSPLSAALGYLELLLSTEVGTLSHDQHKALLGCRRAVLRIFRFMNEALALPNMDTQFGMEIMLPPKPEVATAQDAEPAGNDGDGTGK